MQPLIIYSGFISQLMPRFSQHYSDGVVVHSVALLPLGTRVSSLILNMAYNLCGDSHVLLFLCVGLCRVPTTKIG